MFKAIRKKIIQFLVSKLGGVLVTIITAGIAAAVAKASSYVPAIEGMIDQQQVAAVVWAALLAGINFATNKWLTDDAKDVQEALNRTGSRLDVDGWVGDDTVQEIIRKTGLPVRRAVTVKPGTYGSPPVVLLGVLLLLQGCATTTGDATKDARARATNAALLEAGKVLGRVAVSSLMNVAQQEMRGGQADYGHAVSHGIWSNAGTIIDSHAIANVVEAYSGRKLSNTANEAADVFRASLAPPAAKADAIAAVISAAASKPANILP